MATMAQSRATFRVQFEGSPEPIAREDIRVGDTIRVSYTDHGVTIDRTGVVDLVADDHLSTAEDAFLWSAYWGGDFRFILLDRPKPKLPTEEGMLIILENSPVEKGPVPLILRAGNWQYLNGETYYTPSAVECHQWKLAGVRAVQA